METSIGSFRTILFCSIRLHGTRWHWFCCQCQYRQSSKARFLFEEREVDAAVGTVLNKAWMLGEVLSFAMFQDKKPIFLEELT